MQLHRLELSDVGPFAGQVDLDFATVGATGLFLLEGPTGSGKSTILDAIVYALYGQVAGPHASSDRIRSQFADPNTESVVTLTLETNSGVFRIRRTPSYSRPKRSGEGKTTQQATVKLWRLATPDAPDGELLSTRHGEVEDEIYRAVGLTRAQFVQTVLLPQGEFATFLRAKPEDRRELLQRLFDTQLFEDVTDELERSRKEAMSKRTAAATAVSHAKTAVVTAAELDGSEAEVLTSASGDELDAAIAQIEAAGSAVLESSRTALLEAEQYHSKLVDELATARAYRETWQRNRRLRSELAVLVAAGPSVSLLRTKVAKFDSATNSVALFEQLENARLACATADALASQLSEAAALTDTPLDDAMHAAQTLLAKLRELEPIEATLEQSSGELRQLEARRSEVDEALTQALERVATLPTTIREVREALAAAQIESSRIDDLSAQLDDHQLRLTSARDASKLMSERNAAQRLVAELSASARVAADEVRRLQHKRIAGIAGELAAGLTAGEACSVCGSTEHPNPATQTADAPSAQDVDGAIAAADAAVNALLKQRAQHEALQQSFTRLHALAGERSVDECEHLCKIAQESLVFAKEDLARREALAGQLRELTTESDALTNQTLVLTTEQTRLADAIEHRRRELAKFTAAVETGRAEFRSIAERRTSTQDRLATLEELQTQRGMAAELATRATLLESQWTSTLISLGLATTSEFCELLAHAEEISENRARVESHDEQRSIVEFGLSEIDGSFDKEPLPEDEIEALSGRVLAASSGRDRAVANHGHVTAAETRAETHIAALRSALIEQQRVRDQTADVIRVAELASASSPENLLRIPLPTYVLMERFREVLSAANARLQEMSNGRFTLEHHVQPEARGRKSGLGLLVRDHFAGHDREAGNLSGGETFYTSLALALGLADVVVAESGGVDLGTLFIDEGFGSLDAETLESVLLEIEKLRSGGRVIGLVSHVEELKQRITERIEIRPSEVGRSTVRVLV